MEAQSVRERAVADFRRGDPLKDIAVRYGVSEGSVSLWAKAAGLRRKQGCRIKERPSTRDWDILQAVRAVVDGVPTLDEIGKRFGMTRAGVHRIYRRWKHWKPVPPFRKGAIVRYNGDDYEVLDPDLFTGTVRSVATGEVTTIEWKVPDRYAVQISPPQRSRRYAEVAA
jgi:transposase